MKTLQLLNNNKGSVIIVAILALAAISITVYMSVDNSVTSSNFVRNTREYKTNQYRSESLLTLAQEFHKETWLNPASDLFDPDVYEAKYDITEDSNYNSDAEDNTAKLDEKNGEKLLFLVGDNNQQVALGTYKIAKIVDQNEHDEHNEDEFKDALTKKFHSLNHTSHPLPGSGFSPKDFEIRRYGIKATGKDDTDTKGKVEIEAGMFKYFTKQQ